MAPLARRVIGLSLLAAATGCGNGESRPSGKPAPVGTPIAGYFAFDDFASSIDLLHTSGWRGHFDPEAGFTTAMGVSEDGDIVIGSASGIFLFGEGDATPTLVGNPLDEPAALFSDGLVGYRFEPGITPVRRDVWWLDFDGTETPLLATTSNDTFVVRRGDQFVVAATDELTGLLSVASPSGSVAPLSTFEPSAPVSLTPSGRVVFEDHPQTGYQDVRSIRVDGSGGTTLAGAASYWESVAGIVGDRVVVLVDLSTYGALAILAVDADGGAPATLSTANDFVHRLDSVNRCPYYDPSPLVVIEERLLFLKRTGDVDDAMPFELMAVPLAGGEPLSLGATDLSGVRCSLGDELLFQPSPESAYLRVDVETGASSEILPEGIFLEDILEGHFLYSTFDPAPHLFSLPVEGGEPVELLAGYEDRRVLTSIHGGFVVRGCDYEQTTCDVRWVSPDGTQDFLLLEQLYGPTILALDGWIVYSVAAEEPMAPPVFYALSLFDWSIRDISPLSDDPNRSFQGFFR